MPWAGVIWAVLGLVGFLMYEAARRILVFTGKVEKDAGMPVWALLAVLAGVLFIVYAFSIHPVAGFVLMVTVGVIAALEPLFMATWGPADPSVKLPDESLEVKQPFTKQGDAWTTRLWFEGEDWLAEFKDDGQPPPGPGDHVQVVDRRGVKLVVGRGAAPQDD